MSPFLQTPTPNSVYICWHSEGSDESKVKYGLTEELTQTATGNYHSFGETLNWHWVKMVGLQPETDYYYKVISDSAESSIHRFQTHHPYSDTLSHVRFAIYSDSQSNPATHSSVVSAMKQTFEDEFGEEYYKEVDDFVAFTKSSPTAEGFNEILVPGEIEMRVREERMKTGIFIEDETWQQVVEWGRKLGQEIGVG